MRAEIVVGVSLSLTGPAAPIGRVQRAVIERLPRQVGGETVRYVVRDDASDATAAAAHAVALVDDEHADLVIGSTTVAASLAILNALAGRQVPMISPAAVPLDVDHEGGRWAYRTAPDETLMVTAVVAHMRSHDVRRAAFIGFADAFGEQWWQRFAGLAELRGIEIVAAARFAPTEHDVHKPIEKLLAARPDAVLVAAAGSAAVAPVVALRQARFAGAIYQTHAVALDAFLNACAGRCDGVLLPASPVRVREQLPPGPIRTAVADFVRELEVGAANGFGASLWDAGRLFAQAVPAALRASQPGTPAFRAALRDALEATREMPGANGVYNMSRKDHAGLDQRGRVMVRIVENQWKLVD